MKQISQKIIHRSLVGSTCVAAVVTLGLSSPASAAPTYSINKVLVAEDQWQGENGVVDPRPLFKPHETDASFFPRYWISSNERGAEEEGEAVPSRAGITIFKNGSNKVLSKLEIEDMCLPVVNPDGSNYGCAPPGAEGHPRHPHGIDIDVFRQKAYQVIEHSGLQWNADRTGFDVAENTDTESGLLLVYDIRNPRKPKILESYVVGHGAEEVAVNEVNGKAYVGNHEPSPTDVPCFVSVIKRNSSSPYRFIDLADEFQCVQGLQVDESLGTVNGTTHIGEVMYTFKSRTDTIAYSVDIRGPFEDFFGELSDDVVLHMHDLATDRKRHRAYNAIHTIAGVVESEEGSEEEAAELSGRWVAEVNTNPRSRKFKQVNIIDLSNGQTADVVLNHSDAEGLFEDRFVHAHFLEVDPVRKALLVSGEHTGNLGVVNTRTRQLEQVIAISRPIPGCVRVPEVDEVTGEVLPLGPAEPHVHGVNIQHLAGTVYVSDEGEDCFYESVTVLKQADDGDDDDDDDD